LSYFQEKSSDFDRKKGFGSEFKEEERFNEALGAKARCLQERTIVHQHAQLVCGGRTTHWQHATMHSHECCPCVGARPTLRRVCLHNCTGFWPLLRDRIFFMFSGRPFC